jgi:hypothetical protein
MRWSDFLAIKPEENQSQEIQSFQYAGPLRIPPPIFQVRSRKETGTIDTINSRTVETNGASLKYNAGDFVRSDDIKDVAKNIPQQFYDMAPLSSRTDKRDFRQSKPYDTSGPSLALNPFFDRYDPTRDPRNMIREVRSVVYELKESDRGIKESQRIRERIFTNRTVPEGSTSVSLTEWQDLLRPKIDNIEVVYRQQGGLATLGSKSL